MNDAVAQEFDFAEFITAPSGNPSHHSHGSEEAELDIFADFQHASSSTSSTVAMNLESAEALLNSFTAGQPQSQEQQQNHSQNAHMQHQHLVQRGQDSQQNPSIITAEMLDLKGRLEQQLKLQQLQQFILQQQMELLNGSAHASTSQILQANTAAQSKDAMFNGLLTPGPSGEIPAMIPKDLVPPMVGMYMDSSPNHLPSHPHLQINPNPSFSAPAALAFPTACYPLPNHDFSPLISPLIRPRGSGNENAEMNSMSQMHAANQTISALSHPSTPHASHPNVASQPSSRPRLKRTGSADDHDLPARKRSLRATPSSSTASTPAIPGSGNFFVQSNDSPSPVDLSMPPPVSTSNSAPTTRPEGESTSHGSGNASIAPMTPATMLNLRKLSTGLVTTIPSGYNGGTDLKDTAASKKGTKVRATVVSAAASSSTTVPSRARRTSTTKPAFSPSLKPLLPGAQPPTPTSPLSLPVNAPPRKSSHKVAEQKRRDSLKTSFDELRFLLPPVALPEDEELLPGCMPPRGPPKGDTEGPNRGVSKLALLRCGNAYIKELKEMVKRRDAEIQDLRMEVKRLRTFFPSDGETEEQKIDLERDVDEGRSVEAGIRLTMRTDITAGSGASVGAGDEADEEE